MRRGQPYLARIIRLASLLRGTHTVDIKRSLQMGCSRKMDNKNCGNGCFFHRSFVLEMKNVERKCVY
jgi:hypothetical protein